MCIWKGWVDLFIRSNGIAQNKLNQFKHDQLETNNIFLHYTPDIFFYDSSEVVIGSNSLLTVILYCFYLPTPHKSYLIMKE